MDLKGKGGRFSGCNFLGFALCACACLHGLSGEVLAEVPHDIEGVHRGGGKDAGGRLVAQICGWVRGQRDQGVELRGGGGAGNYMRGKKETQNGRGEKKEDSLLGN